MAIHLDGFPIKTSERQLEGCDDPLTFDFPLEEIREPGVYLFTADLFPSKDHTEITGEYQ